VQLWTFPSAEHEADAIARRIRAAVTQQGRKYDDFAVVYRINALSRLLEHALRRYRIPFQIAAGFEFYERAEIKDALAYLRLVHNPADRAAFVRIVNTPLRGLGKTSQDRLLRWADEQGLPCLEAAARAGEILQLSKQARAGFQRFAELMQEFSLADAGSVEGLLVRILERTRLAAAWEGSPSEEDQQRLANVNELIAAARSFDRMLGSQTSLEAFLEQTSLVNETDALDESAGRVTLLTLHAAKGLEFPVVYIVGLEQGLLPHERAISGDADPHELEEERRLLFVGMTRAREELHLTIAQQRNLRGQERFTIPSAFLGELEAERGVATEEDESAVPVEEVGEGAAATSADSSPHPASARGPERSARGAAVPLGDLKSRLMTGADLLNGARSTVELPTGFAVGAQVRHPRYGLGTVIDVSGFGARRTVTVRFEVDDRQQSFVAGQSPLQPVGTGPA
jgi:DNA helicase-2/ATP-dependent DNA helicase PcrA